MQNNDASKTMSMERPDISPTVYCLYQHSLLTNGSIFHAAKTVGQGQKLQGRKCKTVHDFMF